MKQRWSDPVLRERMLNQLAEARTRKSRGRPTITKSATGASNGCSISIRVYFEPEMFEALRRRARDESTSFGEQVRTFVQWGFDSAGEETDEHA